MPVALQGLTYPGRTSRVSKEAARRLRTAMSEMLLAKTGQSLVILLPAASWFAFK